MENCKDPSDFHEDPSIIATFTNGRLGNQISSFATLFGLSKMIGSEIRPGLIYDQFKELSHYFPYFEDHYKKFLIHSWYCGHFCKLRWIEPKGLNLEQQNYDEIVNLTKVIGKYFSKGHAFYLPNYLNEPKIYLPFLEDSQTMFQLRKDYVKSAQKIIDKASKPNLEVSEYSAIIGIHVRLTDYKDHLWKKNSILIGLKFYQKAVQYFREMYKRPLFLVVSDHKKQAIKAVIEPLNVKDVKFVGTIDEGISGLLTKEETVGIDFGILTLCDHLIISHGTFGLWAALLSKHAKKVHIMADNEVSEEVQSMKRAKSKFMFIDDK